MSHKHVIRAWKDAEYRNSLTAAQRAQLPEHPAGLIELTCEELTAVDGSSGSKVTGAPCIIDDLKFTKDGGTFCGTKDITCDRSGANHGLSAKLVN